MMVCNSITNWSCDQFSTWLISFCQKILINFEHELFQNYERRELEAYKNFDQVCISGFLIRRKSYRERSVNRKCSFSKQSKSFLSRVIFSQSLSVVEENQLETGEIYF